MEKETAIEIVKSIIHCTFADSCEKCPKYQEGDIIEIDRSDITNISCSKRSPKDEEQQEEAAKALLSELGIYKEICKKEKRLLGIRQA